MGVRASWIAADAYASVVIASGDCNANGAIDSLEILAGLEIDRDRNAALDTCQCAADPGLVVCCRADFDMSGEVDYADVALILLDFGATGAVIRDLDLDANGEIGGGDISLILLEIGACAN